MSQPSRSYISTVATRICGEGVIDFWIELVDCDGLRLYVLVESNVCIREIYDEMEYIRLGSIPQHLKSHCIKYDVKQK